MSIEIEFIPGPLTSEVTRATAEKGLQHHAAIRKGAKYALEQMDGRWVAAVVLGADAPPFGGGGPADAGEEAPGPKSEGPDDLEPSEGESGGPDKPEGGDSDGPPKDKGDEKGGVEHQLLQIVQAIADALGVPVGMGDSMVPGADDGSMPPPAGPPHGPGGPPAPGGPPHGPGDATTQHVVHERVTKPGETPPGGTPLGSPFASVRSDHPWAHLAGKVASFDVSEKIGNAPMAEVYEELQTLASELPGGYKVHLKEARDSDGERVAVAKITLH